MPARPAPERTRPTPGEGELRTWRRYLVAHARITRALEAELVAAENLSLASYDVLVQLSESPGGTLRMTELAEAVLLSRSGITRLVERLEQYELVQRHPSAEDGRGVEAVITPAGQERLRVAARTHLAGVTEHFVEPLGERGLAEIDLALDRLLGR
jgi:DNA-binding MarR family transcriptional regulator